MVHESHLVDLFILFAFKYRFLSSNGFECCGIICANDDESWVELLRLIYYDVWQIVDSA